MQTVNPDIFETDDVAKSCPVSNGTINQYGGTTYTPSFSRVKPDIIGWVLFPWCFSLEPFAQFHLVARCLSPSFD